MPKIVLITKEKGETSTVYYGPNNRPAAEASAREIKESIERRGHTIDQILHYDTNNEAEVPTVMIL